MFKKTKMNVAVASAIVASFGAHHAGAEIEEVTVTATKRPESTQDIAVAVQALGENSLDELGITNFSDYLMQLPGVTAGGSGPGQNTIYIRGVASTTPNLTVAGVAGLAPNVAFYLDEQPLAQPGRNLDVYTADINRVEVLSGPQGTLFGASSQTGDVRLITTNPNPSGTYARADRGVYYIKDEFAQFWDNVRLTRDENQLNGAYAEIDLVTGVNRLLAAAPDEPPSNQVKGLILPESLEDEKEIGEETLRDDTPVTEE